MPSAVNQPRLFTKMLALMLAVASLSLGMSARGAGADFTFAAFGDTPYTEDEEPRFVSMIAEINRAPLAFSIHVGDFKSGWSPCTDALFLQRREWFALFHQPLIYTPGDNEWADCHRAFGAATDPLERLQKLRELFFADHQSLGQNKIPLARQRAAFPENARWEHEGITFVTVNVPGGNNQRMPAEMAARDQANIAWIISAFAEARARSHRAVVIATQANSISGDSGRGVYAGLMRTIRRETAHFNGEVLFIHGDTHRYRVDQPLSDPNARGALRNFTRLEVFGYPFINWVRVRVIQRDGKVTFVPSPGG